MALANRSTVMTGLFQAWCDLAQDPGSNIIPRLTPGAAAGLSLWTLDAGIFLAKSGEATPTVEQLYRMKLNEDDYRSLTEGPDAGALVSDLFDPAKGWNMTFSSLDAVTRYLGKAPIAPNLTSW